MTIKHFYQAPETYTVTIVAEDVVCNPSTGEHFSTPSEYFDWEEED